MPVDIANISEAGLTVGQETDPSAQTSSNGSGEVSIHIISPWRRPHLSAEDDPVLAEIWDNDDDAVYDSM